MSGTNAASTLDRSIIEAALPKPLPPLLLLPRLPFHRGVSQSAKSVRFIEQLAGWLDRG